MMAPNSQTRSFKATSTASNVPPFSYYPFSRDTEGWTILTPAADTVVTYVSSSAGDDGNDGSIENPIATLGEAYSRLRNNSADWILLKRGDTWDHTFPDWLKRGRSESEPLVIASYGSGPRPLILPGDSYGVLMWDLTFAETWGYSNMVFTDLHFRADWSGAKRGDNPSGFRIDRPGKNLLFENLMIERFATNLTIQAVGGSPMGENIQVRRCIVVDAFAKRYDSSMWDIPGAGNSEPGFPGGSHSQGMYTSRLNNLLIEENVFDHNGWNPEVGGAERTIYNHNLYIQSNNTDNIIIRRNIIARGASHGTQLRPGGVLEDNLYVGNSVAAFIGGAGGRAEGNVLVHGSRDTLLAKTGIYSGPRGWGLSMEKVSGSQALSNFIMHTPGGTSALNNLDGVVNEGNLIYGWGSMHQWDCDLYGEDPIQVQRSLYDYDASLGGEGTIESFLEEARTLDRENWRMSYTATGALAYFFQNPSVPI
jgi:hypothetical protein